MLSEDTIQYHVDNWKRTGIRAFLFREASVSILFSAEDEAHEWARSRGLEAWTVTEVDVWTRADA